MAKLWASLLGRGRERSTLVDDWMDTFSFNGVNFPLFAGGPSGDSEESGQLFEFFTQSAYKACGPVFAAMLARQMLFSEARFQWQRMDDGRPGDLFGTQELRLLERPWPNATTGDLLSRMIQDVDLAGNFFAVREGRRLRRLRPDWVEIVLTADPAQAVQSDIAGYLYRPGGVAAREDEVETFFPERMVHWAPIPDPEAQFRGMSWLSPVVDEFQSDKSATRHKKNFFGNGATLQTVMTLGESVTAAAFKEFVRAFKEAHQGVRNAYEPLFLGGGADAKIVGADMRQLDFRATQGAGETRIAAAAGMHPVILGLSEGLSGSSLNQGNFNAARRLTADKVLRPLWRSASGALETVLRVPRVARLWYDDRDISFLREDRKDQAEIQGSEAQTIRTLLDAGYEGESVKAAVIAQDWKLLEHSGLFSVQLQPAGADTSGGAEPTAEDDDGNDD